MYCKNCGAEISGGNFCPYCGHALTEATSSVSLLNKAVSTANLTDQYNLVLISCGSCDKTTTGDLLEDVFGYTEAESSNLVNMAPVVVGERLNATEARTAAQLFTEYGVEVTITNQQDQYVDLTDNAVSSVFDSAGNLLAGAAAILGSLTVSNRIRAYRRYKKPSLLERIFRIGYKPQPQVYRRNFRPRLSTSPVAPRKVIRKTPPVQHVSPSPFGHMSSGHGPSNHGPSGHGPSGHGPNHGGPGGHRR
jgi:hypothetical protein